MVFKVLHYGIPLLLLSSIPDGRAWNASCPVGGITIAGADSVLRQVSAWGEAFRASHCPDVDITMHGDGYSVGAARVCDNHPLFGAVDVAAMPDTFFNPQATSIDGWNFHCKRSSRKAIMVSSRPQTSYARRKFVVLGNVPLLTNSAHLIFRNSNGCSYMLVIPGSELTWLPGGALRPASDSWVD